jgi:hypothetical protein
LKNGKRFVVVHCSVAVVAIIVIVVLVVVGFAVLVVVVDQKIRETPSVLHPKAVHVGQDVLE